MKKFSRLLNLRTITFFIFLLQMPLFSQRTLISPISWDNFNIPQERSELMDSIMTNPLYDSIWPVEIDYLPELQEEGFVEFELPGLSGSITAFVQQVRYYDENDFV